MKDEGRRNESQRTRRQRSRKDSSRHVLSCYLAFPGGTICSDCGPSTFTRLVLIQ